MTNKLFKQFKRYSKNRPEEAVELRGILGLPVSSETVDVPGRPGYVYVRLRNSNEIIQVFNDKTSNVYNLPVLMNWSEGRYKITSRDSKRYQNWGAGSSFVPEHGHFFEGGIDAQNEGIPLGTGTTINFVGENVDASISGSVIRVFVTGSASGANTELSNLGTTAIDTDLLPTPDMAYAIGQPSQHWLSGWFGKTNFKRQTGTSSPPSGDQQIWADSSGVWHSKSSSGADEILLVDAPSDGLLYARKDGAWAQSSGTATSPPVTGSVPNKDLRKRVRPEPTSP